jgi:hypothetical protein
MLAFQPLRFFRCDSAHGEGKDGPLCVDTCARSHVSRVPTVSTSAGLTEIPRLELFGKRHVGAGGLVGSCMCARGGWGCCGGGV